MKIKEEIWEDVSDTEYLSQVKQHENKEGYTSDIIEDACEEDNQIPQHEYRVAVSRLGGVPIDKGWAWVILSGSVLYTAIYGGINRSFGVFFLQFQERFHAKAGEVAVMSLIQNVTVSITGLLTMTFAVKKLSCRVLVAIGGGLNALSHVITGATRDIWVFYLSHGLLGGMGIVLAGPTIISTIGVYFEKHRGLANSVVAGSASVGGLIFAPVLTFLFDEYGYTGAMIIVAGFLLNTLVTASLMRPPSWFANTKNRKIDVSEKLLSNPCDTDHVSQEPNRCEPEYEHLNDNNMGPKASSSQSISEKMGKANRKEFMQTSIEGVTTCQISCLAGKSTLPLGNHIETSSKAPVGIKQNEPTEIVILNTPPPRKHSHTTDNSKSGVGMQQACSVSPKRILIGVLNTFDFKLLKDIRCILYLLMAFFTVSGMTIIPIYLPQFAKDAGMTYNEIASLVSATACTEFISKIISGVFADRGWIRRSTILAVGAFVTGTVCQFTRFYKTQTIIITMAVLMASFYGWYMSMYAPILMDCLGLEKFHSCLGFLCLIHGLSAASFYPLSGILRDINGSYVYSFHLAGCLCYAGAILLLLISVLQNNQTAKEMTKIKSEI